MAPLKQPIEYRIAVLVWCCLLGLAPAYLWELCSPSLSAGFSLPLFVFSLFLLLVYLHQTRAVPSLCRPLDLEGPPLGVPLSAYFNCTTTGTNVPVVLRFVPIVPGFVP